jgi:DMSO/TMAO reductase YedYZ molybdopterin-dependent catalytic subunit
VEERGESQDGVERDPPERERSEVRAALVAGLAGGAALMAGAAVVHTLSTRVPFLPVALAQSGVRAAPGGFATYFIEALGHWALRLAVIATSAAFLASGALGGLAMLWLRRSLPPVLAGMAGFIPLWAVAALLYPSDASSLPGGTFALATVGLYLLAGEITRRVFDRLSLTPAAASPGLTEGGIGRRYVLRSLWVGGAGLLLGASGLGRLVRPRPDPGRVVAAFRDIRRAPAPVKTSEDGAFDSIGGLAPEVTSNQDFYVVDEEIVDPDVDPAAWVLEVGGLVDRPGSLTYERLTSLPMVERYQTLECISNPVGGGLIGTAKWVGVPLREILGPARPRRGAVEVVFRATSGYSDSLPLDQAMDAETLIVLGMNDHVLPRAHGFPARLLSVGNYGMKNPKWLSSIEVVEHPHIGYWERRGWSVEARVKTWSRIDTPPDGQRLTGRVDLAGVSFAGDRGISHIEVSTDGGTTWAEAMLKTPLSPLTWRLWRYPWPRPLSGERRQLLVRATDGRGILQAAVAADPHPDGASGYHAIEVIA